MKQDLKLIDYNMVKKLFNEEYKKTRQLIQAGESHLDNLAEGFLEADHILRDLPSINISEIERCKNCEFCPSVISEPAK